MLNDEQLNDTALLFMKMGKVEQARKIAVRLLKGDRARLMELTRIELSDSNYIATMTELNEIQQLIRVWR